MKTLRVVFDYGVLLMLSSMATMAQSVRTDYDRSYNLARLKTYGLYEQARRPSDPLAESPLNDRRIHTALDSQLRRRVLAQASSPIFDRLLCDQEKPPVVTENQPLREGFSRFSSKTLTCSRS